MRAGAFWVAGILLAFWAGGAQAAEEPTADSLVAKNLAARGGTEGLAAIKALRLNGRMIFPGGMEITYRETRSRTPNGAVSRTDMSLQGLTLIQAYDGSNAWRVNPFQGRRDAERMSADEARSLADSSLIEGPLQAAQREGSRVTYLGREDFDGTLAYKLKVTEKDGDEFVYLLDPDTFLEIKVTETRRIRGAQQTSETELGDYEKVGGVYFPMSVESWQEGQPNQRARLVVASAEANPAINPAIFAEPAAGARPVADAGEPKDASNQPPGKDEPQTPTTPPSGPPKDK